MTAKPAFRWEDPLLLDAQLTDDSRMIRDSAHVLPADPDAAHPARRPPRAVRSGDHARGRRLETVNTYEGAHDIHALILGRARTGIAAFD